MARADRIDTMVRITLESDQQHSLVADTSELTHLVVKHEGEQHDYLLHVHSLVDGVLEANGVALIAGPCATPHLLAHVPKSARSTGTSVCHLCPTCSWRIR